MRIVTGALKGMRLTGPGPRGGLRPTEDRVREALFSILGRPEGASAFLDLCSGTGAVALEALSRGFRPVVAVESDRGSLQLLRRNVQAARERLGSAPFELQVAPLTVERYLPSAGRRFDVIFCDPPYELITHDFVELLASQAPLEPDGLLVLEHASRGAALPDRAGALTRVRVARYGTCSLAFYRPGDGAPGGEVGP